MLRLKSAITLSIFFFLVSVSFAQKRTILLCGGLIDGINNEVQKEMSVIIEGNQIIEVQKGYLFATTEDDLINLKDYYVMPGLLDMHVHVESQYSKNSYLNRFVKDQATVAYEAAVFAERTLNAGFTTVRDLGGSGVNVALQNAISRGLTDGPRIYTCAKAISITGGHGDPTNGGKEGIFDFPGPERGVADGPDECRKAVRQQVKNGADLIKITATGGVLSVARDGYRPQFTEEEISAIVETANDFGIKVAAHAHGDEGMQRAVRAGISSIEHGTLMSTETMELMKKMGTWYVPTISAGKSVADSAKIQGFFPALVKPKAISIGPKIQSTFAKAYKMGVPIAFGTDAGVFAHGQNAKEFQFMVEAGMPAMEAIQSATVNAAKLLGQEHKLGQIQPAFLADIIAVKQNPIEDVSALMNVSFVMKDGKVYKNER